MYLLLGFEPYIYILVYVTKNGAEQNKTQEMAF